MASGKLAYLAAALLLLAIYAGQASSASSTPATSASASPSTADPAGPTVTGGNSTTTNTTPKTNNTSSNSTDTTPSGAPPGTTPKPTGSVDPNNKDINDDLAGVRNLNCTLKDVNCSPPNVGPKDNDDQLCKAIKVAHECVHNCKGVPADLTTKVDKLYADKHCGASMLQVSSLVLLLAAALKYLL
jgi:hypothetical protein